MKLHLPLTKSRHLTTISAYAPTLTNSAETKEKFYEDLDQLIRSTSPSDKLLIMGDFNARVGKDQASWKRILGSQGVGKMNANGLLLLSKCAEHELCITNTVFRQADKLKTTWMHPRSKQWHLIDYIIVRQRDLRDVCITRAMRGADCWTDHRLIRAVLKLHIASAQRKRPKTVRAAFDIAKLNKDVFCRRFHDTLDANIQNATLTEDSTEKWDQFKNVVSETAKSVLGPTQRIHQDWFDDNDKQITQLLQEKNNAFITWQNDHGSQAKRNRYKHLKKQAQRKLREMKDTWWDRKAEEVQMYAHTHNSKKSFSTLKAVYGPSKPGSTPLLSADGSMLTKDQEGLRNRWAEHFSTLLNKPSTVDPIALEQVPQQPTLNDLDLPPSMDELSKAIKQTNSGRASGKDGIPAEI